MTVHTCVRPPGFFIIGVHKPAFSVANYRKNDFIAPLGRFADNSDYINTVNFPEGTVVENDADWIYEIANPFSFRGSTFIKKEWADKNARHPEKISLPEPPGASMSAFLADLLKNTHKDALDKAFTSLPENVLLAIATTSSDSDDLVRLAEMSCEFVYETESNMPSGLIYEKNAAGRISAGIKNMALFESVVNNPCLPDAYKKAMVLRPGVQGDSEIVGEYQPADGRSHVFEYLRRNSYISWGHYAANMADDAVRYSLAELSADDMNGLRHLYYQRTFARIAGDLDLEAPEERTMIEADNLEDLRRRVVAKLDDPNVFEKVKFTATLWGWNYGFDFSPSHYRLHASHQQIHQQFAMLPETVEAVFCGPAVSEEKQLQSYGCGDLVQHFIAEYRREYTRSFFDDYIAAIRANRRVDGNSDGPQSLLVYEDDHIMLFVPKAQTSQWELQLMTKAPVGNIIEANTEIRASLDRGILTAMQIYSALGARMVTSIEFPKRLKAKEKDQRLLYSFLPKLPESMGAFSEAQLRWINGHYPEDFAQACRSKLAGQ